MSVYLSQYFRSHLVLLEASKLQTWRQRIENDSKAFLTFPDRSQFRHRGFGQQQQKKSAVWGLS